MAIQWIEDGAVFSSSPSWYRRVGYEEIGRDATTVTIRVHLQLKLKGNSSSTFYGYPAYWSVNDGGQMQVKTSSRWYGGQDYRGFYTDIRVGANAGGGSSTFKISMWSTLGGNASFSNNYTFYYSKWNTKPYWISGAKVTLRENNANGRIISNDAWSTENIYKFAENIGAIYVDWAGQARDNENNPLYYELWSQVSESSWSLIYSGQATNFTHYIGSGKETQGRSYDYFVKVKDSYGEWADGTCDATQVQKNQLSPAMLNHNGNVNFESTGISMSRGNGSNTNGNGSFTYRLTSDHIPVYNGENISSNSFTVAIYKGGATPTTPYVKWDELKKYLSGNNYNRTVRFVLTTTNAYGSTATDYEDVWCDIRKNPTNFSFNAISGATVVNGQSYFIPSEKDFTITWGVATDPVGTQITYDVYYAYDNVVWNPLITGTTKNTYTGSFPTVSKQTALTFRIVAKTAYGTSTATEGGLTQLHYVSNPTVTLNLTRNQLNYVINGSVKINSSIPNLSLSSVKYRIGESTTDNNATINGLNFSVTRNLGETESEDLNFYVLDRGNSDLSNSPVTQKIVIGRYMPMFSIREKGVGVNTIPTGNKKLEVVGGIKVDGGAEITGGLIVDGKSITDLRSKRLPVNTDLNEVTELGFYYSPANVDAETMKNLPVNIAFSLLVERHAGTKQTFTTYSEGDVRTWIRNRYLNSWSEWKQVLTTDNYARNNSSVYGKIPYIQTDGVMEVGKYIDFHLPNSNADFDARLTLNDNKCLSYNDWFKAEAILGGNCKLQGNDIRINEKRALVGWANGGDPLIINYNKDFGGGTRIQGYTEIVEGANLLNLKGGSVNHCYMGFFPRQDTNFRGAWMGYGSNGAVEFNINNDIGDIVLGTGSWVRTQSLKTRYLRGHDNNNIDLIVDRGATIYFNVNASSGCALNLNSSFSGSGGTEPSLFNTKGKGWGFLGSADYSFYRVYGAGGTVSRRATKYDIHKFDNALLYDYVKQMNIYAYRTLSNELDENGNLVQNIKRSDMQLGCMIDELPTEVVFYDDEGGNGGAVDNYSYSTLILGGLKVTQEKVENNEEKIQRMETELENSQFKINELQQENQNLKSRLDLVEGILKKHGIN